MMAKLRAKLTKKVVLLALSNAVLILLFFICIARFNSLAGMLLSQQMAERWTGSSDINFAQISCFLPNGSEVVDTDIFRFRSDLERKLTENSIDAPEGGKLWTDAYSALGKINITGPRASASMDAIGVGGDYFAFHPLRLRSGVYIGGGDLMLDRVVLDVEAAWKLFGAVEVAGMEVKIGGLPYIVAGVVERESDFASELAYPENGGLYVSLDTLRKQGGSGPVCYEIVLPNPISGFAERLVGETFPVKGEVIENTGRFSLRGTWGVMREYGKRSMRVGNTPYPYWENAARAVEDHLALTLALAVMSALFPLICLVVITVRAIKKLYAKLRAWLREKAGDTYEKIRTSRKGEKHG